MRFALRNQDKIIEAYDKKILDRILSSLKEHFERFTEIDIVHYDGDKFATLWINDNGHSCGQIGFYVIEIKYDVYRLAFREFIN